MNRNQDSVRGQRQDTHSLLDFWGTPGARLEGREVITPRPDFRGRGNAVLEAGQGHQGRGLGSAGATPPAAPAAPHSTRGASTSRAPSGRVRH